MSAENKSNEIRIIRMYEASVKRVWDAWTDPEQLAMWWGPRGYTITTHSKDLRTGGSWVFTMHGPDGTDYSNKTTYLEVDEYKRLVYDHGGNDDRPPMFRVSVLFSELEGKTKMEMSMILPSPEAAAEARKFIKKAGGYSTWDRLAEYLAKDATGQELFVINRSFDVPVKTLFEMWSNPKHFAQWLPPSGFKMETIRANIKPDGDIFYKMSGSDITMYGRIRYLEVKPHDRIVYTQEFCDEHENLSRHPLSPTWPATVLTTVTLSPEGDNKSRVTIVWECHGPTSAEELNAFIKERSGMTQGWTGSFDKLEDYLEAENF